MAWRVRLLELGDQGAVFGALEQGLPCDDSASADGMTSCHDLAGPLGVRGHAVQAGWRGSGGGACRGEKRTSGCRAGQARPRRRARRRSSPGCLPAGARFHATHRLGSRALRHRPQFFLRMAAMPGERSCQRPTATAGSVAASQPAVRPRQRRSPARRDRMRPAGPGPGREPAVAARNSPGTASGSASTSAACPAAPSAMTVHRARAGTVHRPGARWARPRFIARRVVPHLDRGHAAAPRAGKAPSAPADRGSSRSPMPSPRRRSGARRRPGLPQHRRRADHSDLATSAALTSAGAAAVSS